MLRPTASLVFGAAMMFAGSLGLSPAWAAEGDEVNKASPHCEKVQITVKNSSGQAIKLISIDHATTGRWKRGKIVFRTIEDGGSFTWSGSFKEMAGKEARFRVNTRYVIDAQTDRYSDLNSATVSTTACESEEKHEINVGKPSS